MRRWFKVDLVVSLGSIYVMWLGLVTYQPGIYMTGVAIFFCGFPMTEIKRIKRLDQE